MNKALAAALLLLLLVPLGRYIAALPSNTGAATPLDVQVSQLPHLDQSSDMDLAPVDARTIDRATVQAQEEAIPDPAANDFAGAEMRSLLVIDSVGRTPIANAEVWAVPQIALARITMEQTIGLTRSMPGGFRELGMEIGRPLRTGDDGRVDIPVADDGTMIIARRGVLHGMGDASPYDEESIVMIGADRTVEVRTIDARGNPLPGIPVVIATKSLPAYMEREGQLNLARARTESGDGGATATLALGHDVFPGDDSESPLVVALDFPLAERVEVALFRTRWPDEPLTLVVPDVGAVRLDVLDGAAGGQADDLFVRVGRTPEGGPIVPGSTGLHEVVLDAGRARLWPVGLGLELSASIQPGAPGPFVDRTFEGPTVQGEEREVEVTIGAQAVELTGRLVDTDGGPVAGSPMLVSLNQAIVTDRLEPSEDGSFTVSIALDPAETKERWLAIGERSGFERVAVTALPNRPIGDTIDLGVLRLVDRTIAFPAGHEIDGTAISVQVVDLDGAPVEGASVALVRPVATDGSRARWQPIDDAIGSTDAEGRVRVAVPDGLEEDTRITAAAGNGLRHEPIAIESGEAGPVVLTMQPGASLEGRLELDDGVTPESVRVTLWDEATGSAPSRTHVSGWQRFSMRKDGRFHIGGLEPGRYTVRASVGERQEDAITIEGVDLRVGENRDPRLDPLDMRGMFRTLELIVVDGSGAPLRAEVYGFEQVERDGALSFVGPKRLGSSGSGSLVVGTDVSHTLIVRTDGYFPVRLDPNHLPNPVVLHGGFDVTINWVGPGTLADIPGALTVALAPVDDGAPDSVDRYLRTWAPGSEGSNTNGPARFGSDGRALARVPGPGVYRLDYSVRYEPIPDIVLERSVQPIEASTVTVSGEDASFDATLEGSSREVAVAWLRERFDQMVERGSFPADLEFGDVVR